MKSKGLSTNLSTSNLSTLIYRFFKLFGTFFNLSTPYFKVLNQFLFKKSDVSTPTVFLCMFCCISKEIKFKFYICS